MAKKKDMAGNQPKPVTASNNNTSSIPQNSSENIQKVNNDSITFKKPTTDTTDEHQKNT